MSRNDVGYGKPPKATQYRPGQSGNPKGRPKGSINLRKAILEALVKEGNAFVTITENGEVLRLTKYELAAKQLMNKAAAGDTRSLAFVLNTCPEEQDEHVCPPQVVIVDNVPKCDCELNRIMNPVKFPDKPK